MHFFFTLRSHVCSILLLFQEICCKIFFPIRQFMLALSLCWIWYIYPFSTILNPAPLKVGRGLALISIGPPGETSTTPWTTPHPMHYAFTGIKRKLCAHSHDLNPGPSSCCKAIVLLRIINLHTNIMFWARLISWLVSPVITWGCDWL